MSIGALWAPFSMPRLSPQPAGGATCLERDMMGFEPRATAWEVGERVRWVAATDGTLSSYFFGRVIQVVDSAAGPQLVVIRVEDGRATRIALGGELLYEAEGTPPDMPPFTVDEP